MTSQPWQPPQYPEIQIRQGYVDYVCDRCGVAVLDIIAHNRHHKSLEELKEGLVALTQIVVPGLPPNSILMAAEPEMQEIAKAIQAGRVKIGEGGTGPDPDIPECPICHCYGGGGHGGFCPNFGLPPEEWKTP